jgi:glycosyltransferase involved in cell wall biosynthesis
MPNEKDEIKKILKIEDKKFVLLTVMRNKSPLQKNFPALFQAWKSMLLSHPELQKNGVLLCLTDPLEVGSTRLDMLRDRTGLKDFVKFIWAKPTKDYSSIEMTYEGDPNGLWHNANINFSAEEMAKLYNVADLFAVSSYGESFNLPCLESMACGIPQINCNHTTGPELVGIPKAGLLADVIATMTNPLITESWIIDPNSLIKCIDTLYTDEKLRKECGKNALENAKNYSWDKIISEWLNLFKIVESDRMNVDYSKMKLGI